MSEIKRLLNALLWEIYGRIPAANLRRQRKSELKSMHPKLYEPRLLARLRTKVLDDICDILQLEIRLMSKYLERVLISRDKNRTQQTILYGFLGVIVSSRLGESSREMRFTLSPPPGAAKGRGESTRTGTVEETTSPSDFSQWLHAMKMVARLPGGMPPEFRRKLWLALAEKYLKAKNVDWVKEEEKCFSEQWREDDEELGIQIVKDLHRTGSSLCSGPAGTINQAKLKRILLGYARYNPEVGYCQGFNMLGALILQVMDKEEIESIKVMIYLVEGILPRGYFSGSLGGLQADMAVFRELMTSKLPRLAKHLQKLQGPMENAFEPPLTNVFTMQWFLTMFCTCLPMTCVLRVWDLVLIEGSDVLLRTALVLWSLLEERILSAKTADDFYCKMGSFSSELLNGHLIDSNGLIEKVVELGPVPDLQKMRDKHLYNISPFRDQKGLQLYYSDEDGDSDEDSQMAVATAWGLRLSRRGSAGLSNKTDGKERIALDISLLKKQYDRLRERQRQAHIILTSAVARQGSNPQTSIQMNQLLIGRNAIVTNNGRRLGPPQGAIPPARKPSLPTSVKSSKLVQSKPLRRGETLHWRDTELSKRRRGSVKWKDIKPSSQQASQDERTPQLVDSAPSSRSSSSEPKSQRNSFKTHQRSDSSSYSEDSDGNSSTSTSLCDEDEHEAGDKNASSLEASPLKKSKSSKKHAEGSHKKSLDDILSSNEKQHTTQIPFVQLTTMGSPLLSANKTELDSLEYAKEDSETESNRLEYAGFVDEYSWPDITEPAKSAPLEDLKIDVTAQDTDYLSLPTAITSISQLSPIADISTYIKSSSISPLRTPISAFDYSNLVGSTDDPKDFNVNDEGVTNEYFERVNIVERPTKLDLLYSLNEEDSIRNAFKSREASPEESISKETTSKPKVTLEESNELTTHPLTEEVDRKMKVLLEYSNQSSLSFIAEAKHEISSGLFKDKEFESNSLKTLSVPYTRRKEPVEETTDIILPLPKVEFKVTDQELWSCKDLAEGDPCKGVEVPKQTTSDELQSALAPKSIPLKIEHGEICSEIRSEPRKSFIEVDTDAVLHKKTDLEKESASEFTSSNALQSVLAPKSTPLKTEHRISTESGERFGSEVRSEQRKSFIEEDADAFLHKKTDLEKESASEFTSSDALQSVLAPKSTPPKTEHRISTESGERFGSEVRSEQRKSFIEEEADAFSQKKGDFGAESASGFTDASQSVLARKDTPYKTEQKDPTVRGEELRSELRRSFVEEDTDAFSQKKRDLPAESASGFTSSDAMQIVLAPRSIPLKTQHRISSESGEGFNSEIRSELRKSYIEEEAGAYLQPDLEAESSSRSLHIPTTENLETRFNALELTFVDRVDSLKDPISLKPTKGEAVKDIFQRPQIPNDKSSSKFVVPSAGELEMLPSTKEPEDLGADSQTFSSAQSIGEDSANVDKMLPETSAPIENEAKDSNKIHGLFVEPDREDKLPSSDYEPSFLTRRDHSEEEISDANARADVFNAEEYQSFGQEQCKDEGSSGVAAHDLNVNYVETGQRDEEKYVSENKVSQESEKDSGSKGTETAHDSYSFVPTPDVQITKVVFSEDILSSSSFLEKQIVEKKTGDQEMRAESDDLNQTDQESLVSRPSDLRENESNSEKAPILLATKPVCEFRGDTSAKPENSRSREKPEGELGPTRKSIIPSTEDLESRFMALERQFSEKSISLPKATVDPTATIPKSPLKEKSAPENIPEVTVKTTIEISVTENPSPATENETHAKSENQKKTIPTTAALEERYEQLERKLSEHNLIASNASSAEVSIKRKALSDNESQAPKSPSEKLSEPPFVRKRIPSTEDLENRFKALEIQKAMKSPTAATTSLLSPLGSSVALPFSKPAIDDNSNVPSTEALESRFKALETSKPLEGTLREDAMNLSLTSDSGIPSTRDLENRFEALEQQKKDSKRKHKVREIKNQELSSDSKPTAYSGLREEIPKDSDGAGEAALKLAETVDQCKQETKKLPSTHDLELRFDALQGSSNSLELKSSKDIMNENMKHSKHIPSTQDLETRFKILEGSKPQPLDHNHETTSKRPLSQHFEVDAICNVSRPLDDQVGKAKDLQVMRYDPERRREKDEASVNNDSTPTNCSEITVSFRRKDLYKVESQSDETLTATDPASSEFDTKIESRPTSCPEYNDAIYSNTVNTDRVLKIIEENSKILHRILKKTLADAGNLETSTQHKIIHPGITDSLLALGNIFPRSDETLTPSGGGGGDGTKSRSPYRSCITLHSDDNISDRLASIKSTIKSIDTLCEEKSFRKDKCQKYIDSLFAHSKISTAIPLNPSIRVEDFEANLPQSRVSKRELKKDISPRRRRDEEREEYESRVRRDTMPNSLDPSSELSCSLASFDVDKEVDRIDQEKTTQRPVSPYLGSGYELNKRSVTPVVYIPTKLEIRHTTVTSTFYDRYLTEKEIEKTFPKSKKSPVSPTVTKSYLDISKYSSTNVNDRNSKSAENSPSRRKDAADLFLYEKSAPASNQHTLTSNLGVGQKDLHIQSCDNILLRLQSTTHPKDMDKPLLVYSPLQRKPPDLGISRGLYKDYGSDESTKS